DDDPAQVGVPGLGDAPAPAVGAARVLARDGTTVAHQLARLGKAGQRAGFRDDADGGQFGDPAQRLQPGDHGPHRGGREVGGRGGAPSRAPGPRSNGAGRASRRRADPPPPDRPPPPAPGWGRPPHTAPRGHSAAVTARTLWGPPRSRPAASPGGRASSPGGARPRACSGSSPASGPRPPVRPPPPRSSRRVHPAPQIGYPCPSTGSFRM